MESIDVTLAAITQLLDEIEDYDFQCEGGPLHNALPWQRLRQLLNDLRQLLNDLPSLL